MTTLYDHSKKDFVSWYIDMHWFMLGLLVGVIAGFIATALTIFKKEGI